jgi:hypothetical protein
MSELTPRTQELLDILQEEAAEVIQIISKIKRFGMYSYHPDDPEKTTNIAHLSVEIGDFVAIVDLLTQGELNSNHGLSWDEDFDGIDSIAANVTKKKNKLEKFLRT